MAEQSIPAATNVADIRAAREIESKRGGAIDFACVDGDALLQVKPSMGSRARLQLALDLLGHASLTLSNSNAAAVDLPWATAGLVEHAVMTAEALLRAEVED